MEIKEKVKRKEKNGQKTKERILNKETKILYLPQSPKHYLIDMFNLM